MTVLQTEMLNVIKLTAVRWKSRRFSSDCRFLASNTTALRALFWKCVPGTGTPPAVSAPRRRFRASRRDSVLIYYMPARGMRREIVEPRTATRNLTDYLVDSALGITLGNPGDGALCGMDI